MKLSYSLTNPAHVDNIVATLRILISIEELEHFKRQLKLHGPSLVLETFIGHILDVANSFGTPIQRDQT